MFGNFTRFSRGFGTCTKFFIRFWKVHQIYGLPSVSASTRKKISKKRVFWWHVKMQNAPPIEFHQVFTKFWKLQLSPGFGNVTKCSPSFHNFSPGFTSPSFHETLFGKKAAGFRRNMFPFHVIAKKKRRKRCLFSWKHNTLLWNQILVVFWKAFRKQLNNGVATAAGFTYSNQADGPRYARHGLLPKMSDENHGSWAGKK